MSESVAKIQSLPLVEGQVVTGTLFSEPMRVETVRESGPGTWVVGLSGVNTERFRKVTLTSAGPSAASNPKAPLHLRRRRAGSQDWPPNRGFKWITLSGATLPFERSERCCTT